MIEVIKPGTPVKLKGCNIEGHITEVIITENDVWYKVSYFYDGELTEPTIFSFQFEPLTNNKAIIGFASKVIECPCCGQGYSAD